MAPVFYTISPRPFPPDDALPRLQKDQHINLWSPEIRAKSTFKSSRTITGLHYQQSRCNFLNEWEVKICEQTVTIKNIKYIRSI